MAKIVVTSDWHIGARLATAGPAAPAFREAKLRTAERIVELCRKEDARALFLLGDIFDGDRVGAAEVRRAAELLARAPCPVFVLPGNHDWWHPGGVLEAFAGEAKEKDAIRVLLKEEPLTVEGVARVTFFPCPVLRHAGVADPTLWIPARRPEHGLRVGLIHGALDRAEWGGRVPEKVADARDLDLALLGDWHNPASGLDMRTHYPGSPEPGGFDEEHEGQVIVASLEAGGPDVRRVPVGELRWRRIERTLESEAIGGLGVKALEEALAALDASPATTAVRLRLSGSLSAEELNHLDEVLERARGAGWAHCDIDRQVACARDPDLEAFEDESVRAVARRVWESREDEAVRRRALAILEATVEAAR
ncbi:MAG: DNA repair exonuclease [Planctomycetes bacterium]|nr:DNA repair exonuclease [Planctomycetota bacterium]